jgi:hypothetical protein
MISFGFYLYIWLIRIVGTSDPVDPLAPTTSISLSIAYEYSPSSLDSLYMIRFSSATKPYIKKTPTLPSPSPLSSKILFSSSPHIQLIS